MPRETIRKLSENIGRLLVAGGHLAPADPALASSRDALAKLASQLGDKAPVIGKLADATSGAIAASGKQAVRELLTLATRVSQVRAAQAQPAAAPAAGDSQPLVAVPPVATPCNAKDLDDLYRALVEKGQGRMEVINRAVEGDYIADLRLVEPLIHAMADVYIGGTVTESAIPKLGRAVIAPIRKRLDVKGKATDARRLTALVAVEKAGARDLLERALREGSAEVREAALDAIADHVPGLAEFEAPVLELIDKERARDARRAAIRALAGYGSERSFEALMDGLELESTRRAAGEALARSTHPQAVRRMLDRIAALRAAAPAAKKPAAAAKGGTKGGTKGSTTTGKKPDKTKPDKDARKETVATLLRALAAQRDPQIAAAALELVPTFGAVAADAVVANGAAADLVKIAELLREDDDDLFPAAARAALALGPDDALKRFGALVKAKDRDSKLGHKRLAAAAAAIDHMLQSAPACDPRWVEFLVKVATNEPREVAEHVVPPLGSTRDRRAVKPLLALLQAGGRRDDVTEETIRALGKLGDPAALDVILGELESKVYRVRWAVREAVNEIGDPAAVGKVRDLYVKLKTPTGWANWHIRSLLRTLEQRFPGA